MTTPVYGPAPTKPMCRFGTQCSRRNPAHFQEENHPDDHPLFAPAGAAADTVLDPCTYGPAPGKPMCRFGVRCTRKNPAHYDEENHPDDHPFFLPPSSSAKTADLTGRKRPAPATPPEAPERVADCIASAATDRAPASPAAAAPAAPRPALSETENTSADTDADGSAAPAAFSTPLPASYSREAWRPVLHEAFLTPFADDVFALFELCRSVQPLDPLGALTCGGLTPLAPFRLLAGQASAASPLADRGEHDAAEFQPLLRVGPASEGRALGYWRDDPDQPSSFVVERRPLSHTATASAAHHGPGVSYAVKAENLLGAARQQLLEEAKAGTLRSGHAARLAAGVLASAEKEAMTADAEGEKVKAAGARKRRPGFKWVETSNKMGLVIPYDRKTELGYRRLHLIGKELRQLLARICGCPEAERVQHQSELDELINWSNIANDESDFGASLQLGTDLLNHDVRFAPAAQQQLTTAYTLLNKRAFADLARRHGEQRRRAFDARQAS
jgi:hypothetical protein